MQRIKKEKIMESIIVQMLKKINSCKSISEFDELINDIQLIEIMIMDTYKYDEEKVSNIIEKYKNEIDFLRKNEISLKPQTSKNRCNTNIQQLLNLRRCLIRIATMRVLKESGEEIIVEHILEDDEKIIFLLEKTMKKE